MSIYYNKKICFAEVNEISDNQYFIVHNFILSLIVRLQLRDKIRMIHTS